MKLPFAPILACAALLGASPFPTTRAAEPHQMENLGRGLVGLRTGSDDVFLSWRLLGQEPSDTAFDIFRADGDGYPFKINASAITASTNFYDRAAPAGQTYTYYIRAAYDAVTQPPGKPFVVGPSADLATYFNIPLNKPPGGTTPDNVAYTYSANDCSVADLDNDGEYEVVLKWNPSNAKDNSQSGYTGNVLLDAYKLDGTHLWRIDLGPNIRAGAHYTQFLVYDFDGDGHAELACRTAEGSRDATGAFVAQPERFTGDRPTIDHAADRRNANGYILQGPEFLTVFDGRNGSELASTLYNPQRVPGTFFPTTAQINSVWGDNYGNRIDRFLAGVAYLDGQRPSMVFARGYYTRAAILALDWRDGQLTQRWLFDTHDNPALAAYRGQGAHSITVGDVDADGKDEIVYGAATIDHDGTGLYSTGLGHGDALHLSDMDPARPGLEIWMIHETPTAYGPNGSELHDAATGAILYGVSGEGIDIGRGLAADIDPRTLGYETWASRGGLRNAAGQLISNSRPSSMNFAVYWDGDLLRELLDGTTISKWDWTDSRLVTLLQATGAASNNGTKATPNLSADLFGDWREEVLLRDTDSQNLRIYTTTIETSHRLPTLMHDRQYRLAIAWQNGGYNQPPHPSYYLGDGMQSPPRPDIYLVGQGESPDSASPAQRFAQWLEARNLPADSDPDLDLDGNGLSLLAEYAFDRAASHSPILAIAQPDPTGIVHFTIPTPREEFHYVVDKSPDLKTWQDHFAVLGLQPSVAFHVPLSDQYAYFRLSLSNTTE